MNRTNISAHSLRDVILVDMDNYGHARSYLYALVDKGRMPQKLSSEFDREVSGLNAVPLLNDPKYEMLSSHAAMLVYPKNYETEPHEYVSSMSKLFNHNSDTISAWIVSELNPEELIKHLSSATYCYDKDNNQYFLRYYDPLSTPVLYKIADHDWVKWFFGSIISWWYPISSPTEESWDRLSNNSLGDLAQKPVRLVLTDELWGALANDPYPYRLLNFLEKQHGIKFTNECYGVRLTQIEHLIKEAKHAGLSKQEDITTYVIGIIKVPDRVNDPVWLSFVRKASGGDAPLEAYFSV